MVLNKQDIAVFILATLLLLLSMVSIPNTWASDSKRIEMTAKEFRFEPDRLTVDHGQNVVIVFHNQGVLSHNLSVDGLGAKTKTIYPGETDKLVFTPEKAGKYSFHCTVPGHTEAGMRGTLIVR